jgi:hypothetical protein
MTRATEGSNLPAHLSLLALLTFGAESKRTTRKKPSPSTTTTTTSTDVGPWPRHRSLLTSVLGDTAAAVASHPSYSLA